MLPLRNRLRDVVVLLSSALAVLFVAGCTQERNEFKPPPPPAVTVAKPLERGVVDYFETTGNTRSVRRVELRARVGGYLQQIAFKDGEIVEEGALLFAIDKAPFEAALASAQADLEKNQAQLKLATAQLERTRALIQRSAATNDQLDIAEAERASAAADVASAKAAIRQAELDLSFTEVRAPFGGRVGEHRIDVGNLVQAGETLLATLESVDPIYAYFYLSESDLLRFLGLQQSGDLTINEADPPAIELAIGETGNFAYNGKLDFREFGVDPATGTTLRRAVFENDGQQLVPGLFVRVRAAIGEAKPRLLVEERAVGSDQRGSYVLVVNEKNVVEYRPVTLGRSDAGLRVIENGLAAGDRIVVNGLQRARPGAPVTPEEVEMAASLTQQPTAFRLSPSRPSAVAASPQVNQTTGRE